MRKTLAAITCLRFRARPSPARFACVASAALIACATIWAASLMPAHAGDVRGADSVRVCDQVGCRYVSRDEARGIPQTRFGTYTRAPKKAAAKRAVPAPAPRKARELIITGP